MGTSAPTPPPPLRGFRGPEACALARISYRQLDYWARTGLVTPTLRPAHGSGTQRLYARSDVIDLALVKVLLDAGCSLQLVRQVLPTVRHDRGLQVPTTPVVFRGAANIVTLTVDVAALAALIPEPPDEPATQAASEQAGPTLTLVP